MRFVVTDKNNFKLTYQIDKDSVVIGRGRAADAQINSQEVSRNHAILIHSNGRYYIQDVGATNGVFVNTERLKAHEKVEIQSYFSISLGPNVTLQLLEEEEPEPTSIGVNLSERQNLTTLTRQTRFAVMPPASAQIKKPQVSKEQRDAKRTMFIIALIFGGGIFYFFGQSKDQAPAPAPAAVTVQKDPKLIELDKHLTFGQRGFYRELEKDFQNLCQSVEKTYCDKLMPPLLEGEGARIKDKELLVFRKIAEITKDENFSQVPQTFRYDFKLLYYAVKVASEINKFEGYALADFEITENKNFLPHAQIFISPTMFRPLKLNDVMNILIKVKDLGDLNDYKAKIEGKFTISYFSDPKVLNQ